MNKDFNKIALLVICLCALQNVFGQEKFDGFKDFRAMKDKAQSLRGGKAYRVTETTETYADDGKIVKNKCVSIQEFSTSDSFRHLMTIESGGVTEKFEYIRIGEKSYIKEGSKPWRVPTPESESETGVGLASTEGGKFVEKTTFNGQTVNVYEERTNSYEGDNERGTITRYWFAEDGELLKTEARETNLKTGEVSRGVSIYEYDPKIAIKAPVK